MLHTVKLIERRHPESAGGIVATLVLLSASALALGAAPGEHGYPPGVGQWMAMNLEPADDGEYRWRIDFDAMELLLREQLP
jgi:hypothetical protein